MKTVSIQGREYVPVSERIKEFRKLHPQYSIRTEIVAADEIQCLMKAVIRDESDRILAEGTAFEKAASSFINKGSHVENCETSAIGRALGVLGIGIDASVATADEVANAVLNQNKPIVKREDTDKCSTGDVVAIVDLCKETKSDIQKVYAFYRVINGVPTKDQAKVVIDGLLKKLASQIVAK